MRFRSIRAVPYRRISRAFVTYRTVPRGIPGSSCAVPYQRNNQHPEPYYTAVPCRIVGPYTALLTSPQGYKKGKGLPPPLTQLIHTASPITLIITKRPCWTKTIAHKTVYPANLQEQWVLLQYNICNISRIYSFESDADTKLAIFRPRKIEYALSYCSTQSRTCRHSTYCNTIHNI